MTGPFHLPIGQKDKGTSVTVALASPVPPLKLSLEEDVSPVRRTEASARTGPDHIFVMLSVALCILSGWWLRLEPTSGLLFSILLYFLYCSLIVCRCMCHSICMEIRGQLCRVSFVPLPVTEVPGLELRSPGLH